MLTRILLSFSICLALLIVASSFPISSGANPTPPAPPQVFKAQTKHGRPAFVPGEILVRYRNESTAKSKSASLRVAAIDGSSVQLDLQRFEGSDLIEGRRLA